MKIRKKFIIFSILLGVIPVIISTIICVLNFNDKSMEMIKQNVITSTHDQSINLENFFKQNISDLNSAANMPITKELLKDSNNNINSENTIYNIKILNQLLKSRKVEEYFLSEATLINKKETIIASSNIEVINTIRILTNKNIERLTNNEIIVTNIIESEDFNNGIKSAVIASPVFFENQYEGAMINIIDMSYFKKLLKNLNFFKSGKIAIMDTDGTIAATSSENLDESINEINTTSDLYQQWQAIDFEENPSGIIEYNINGIDKIGYYSRIDNTGWTVFSGVEWNEFKAPIYDSIKNIIAFLICILLLIVLSYIFIINYFSKPILNLLKVIKEIKHGNYKDRFKYDKKNEFGEIATSFNDLIDNMEKNKKYIEDKNRDLQSLTSNIPGGVHRSKLENGEFLFDFISGGCLNLLGYENNEFKEIFNKKREELIYHKDRERVSAEIEDQLINSSKYNVEYRIERKDRSIIWILDNGQIVKDRDGKVSSYNIVINITKSKVIQEELRLSEERYRIISAQTQEIIFEWDINRDIICFSGDWENKFSRETTIIDISKKIYQADSIYKDDIEKLEDILNNIVNGQTYVEGELRLKNIDNKYIWCKIRITAMFDENGNIFKALGVIIDIHEDKEESEKLLFRAQRDSLTSLYNKGTVQSFIEEYIEVEGLNSKGALFVIDVDNFKWFNDNLGHLVGDSVLTNISYIISEVFQENSIVGRIGGDEFIVFLKDADSEEFICKKAEDLMKGFRANFTGEELNHKVSGSVGIAKYPQHGKSFKELFANADKAVYLAKNKGKDNYCFFEDI